MKPSMMRFITQQNENGEVPSVLTHKLFSDEKKHPHRPRSSDHSLFLQFRGFAMP
jgi:hypothetical protein